MKALITRKLGMTSLINEDGTLTPVTLLSVLDNVVIGKRSLEKDGYSALIVGAGSKNNLSKPLEGSLKSLKIKPSIIKEFRIKDEQDEYNVGDKLEPGLFSPGDKVKVSGTSKGKGWAGTIKRYGFHRGRKTHGGRSYRRVGSIGSMYPQHILKGKKMPGQKGGDKTTLSGLKIALVNSENKTIAISGSVPGPKRSIVYVTESK